MKIGFIGIGNMGSAMFKGALTQMNASDLCYTDINEGLKDTIASETGIVALESNIEVVKTASIIVLAIKPQYMDQVLEGIRPALTHRHILLSPAVGVNIDHIKTIIGFDCRVVRCMPNTPALVLEGMSAFTYSHDDFSQDEKETVKGFFNSFGQSVEVPEHMMDEVVAVSGSSPAYFFMMLEAMGDAAVLTGLPRKDAYRMAAQTMLGAAKMVLETGEHPGVLKDAVCSPGGTTIEAVKVLEEKGFRSAIIEAMVACHNKTKKMI